MKIRDNLKAVRIIVMILLLILSVIPLSYSNSILINANSNLNPSAIVKNTPPSAVLGQYNSGQTALNSVTKSRGFQLGGVHTFKYPNSDLAVYVYDSGNNRILAYLNPSLKNDAVPTKVFGQNDSFLTSACNGNNTVSNRPSSKSLCLNRGVYAISQEEEPRFTQMATDSKGNFYVLDQYNNRVLRYNNPFGKAKGEGDTTADYVWGQADFTSKLCNRGNGDTVLSDNGICTSRNIPAATDQFLAGGVDIDNWGNMWVGDSVNNRILRFKYNTVTGVPDSRADIVIGQPNMTIFVNGYSDCDTVPGALCTAYIMKVNKADGELYILHGDLSLNPKYRITVYSPDTFATNPSSYTFNRQFGMDTLTIPRSITFTDANTFLVGNVNIQASDQIMRFSKDGTLLNTIGNNQIVGGNDRGAIDLQEVNGEISVDGNLLYITEQSTNNSVLVFDISNIASNSITYTGEILGGDHYTWNTINGNGLQAPYGLALSNSSKQVFSSDGYRILVWDVSTNPKTNQGARFEIGQPDLTTNLVGGPSGSTGFTFRDKVSGLTVDDKNHKLWVARNQEIYAFDLPITQNYQNPSTTFITRIENSVFFGNVAVSGQPNNFVFNANSLAFDKSDDSLWIIDRINSRVSHLANPYTNPKINLIVGQNDINGIQCNRNDSDKTHPTDKTLCNPTTASFDNFNNLYIGEGVYEGRDDTPGNKRIVEYDRATINSSITAGLLSEPSASRVYSVNGFNINPINSSGFSCLPNNPCNPISMSFDSQNRMLVLTDAYYNVQNKRIFIYSNPLKNLGFVAFNNITDPIMSDPIGQGGFSTYDSNDTLYIQDHTWNRILVFQKPPIVCSSFTYSNWGNCSNGVQTRTVISSLPLGCTGGSPILSQNCVSSYAQVRK